MKNPTLPNVLHICFKVKNYAKQLLESFKIWVFLSMAIMKITIQHTKKVISCSFVNNPGFQ